MAADQIYSERCEQIAKTLPDQLNIDGKMITDSHEIASKLNKFFTTISSRLTSTKKSVQMDDLSKLINYVNEKVPTDTFFKIPLITTSQVTTYIRNLDPGKSTGLDGIGPRILKMSCDTISPSITALITKSITSGRFPNQLNKQRYIQYLKMVQKMTHQTIVRFPFYRLSQNFSKNM